jgi:hypothetical protein
MTYRCRETGIFGFCCAIRRFTSAAESVAEKMSAMWSNGLARTVMALP